MLPQQTPGIVEPYHFCVDIKELSSVGGAIYLYFLFMKFVILLYLISIAVCSIPQILNLQDINNDLEILCKLNSVKNYAIPGNSSSLISYNSTTTNSTVKNNSFNEIINESTVILNCSDYLTSANSFITKFNVDSYSKNLYLFVFN